MTFCSALLSFGSVRWFRPNRRVVSGRSALCLMAAGLVMVSPLVALAQPGPERSRLGRTRAPVLVPLEAAGRGFAPGGGRSGADSRGLSEADRLGTAQREFAWLQAGGDLVRWSASRLRPTGASPLPGVFETWVSVIDGVRVVGASVRRTVRGGRLVDLRGSVLDPSWPAASRRWPSDADPGRAAAGLQAALGPGVTFAVERDAGGEVVRLWIPGFDVRDVFPAYVFVTSDYRLVAADARTGHPLSVEPGVMTGQAPAWTVREFPELWGVDLNLHRAVGSGRGLRDARLLLPLLRTGPVEEPVYRLLDAWDPSVGYQATFDARRVFPRDVPRRCDFAYRFFLPGWHASAYRSTLDHVAVAPAGALGGTDPEDVTVSEAHALMSFVRWYFRDLAGWSGIDGRGSPTPLLVNVVPYGRDADPGCPFRSVFRSNAFYAFIGGPWGQGGFGFGTWISTARSVASAVDVVGHEFAHAVDIHGRRNVFGTPFGHAPQRVFFRTATSPGRLQPTGAWVACGEPFARDAVERMFATVGSTHVALSVEPRDLYPYCVGEYPRRLGFGIVADASEGFADIAGVGAEFARAAGGPLEPDYVMGEDLDGFGIRDLARGLGGPVHMADLRRHLVVARDSSNPCRSLVSFEDLYRLPRSFAVGACALSPVGMYGDRPADLGFGGFSSPHGPGVILGHTFYLALEGAARRAAARRSWAPGGPGCTTSSGRSSRWPRAAPRRRSPCPTWRWPSGPSSRRSTAPMTPSGPRSSRRPTRPACWASERSGSSSLRTVVAGCPVGLSKAARVFVGALFLAAPALAQDFEPVDLETLQRIIGGIAEGGVEQPAPVEPPAPVEGAAPWARSGPGGPDGTSCRRGRVRSGGVRGCPAACCASAAGGSPVPGAGRRRPGLPLAPLVVRSFSRRRAGATPPVGDTPVVGQPGPGSGGSRVVRRCSVRSVVLRAGGAAGRVALFRRQLLRRWDVLVPDGPARRRRDRAGPGPGALGPAPLVLACVARPAG